MAVVATTVATITSPALRARLGLGPGSEPSYVAGTQIDVPADLYKDTSLTLFAFVRENCTACQATKPILGQLSRQLAESSVRTVLMANDLHRDEELRYGTEIGLDAKDVVTMDWATAGLRLQRVPTLVLVTGSGQIVYASEGVPSAEQQTELLQAARSRLQQ